MNNIIIATHSDLFSVYKDGEVFLCRARAKRKFGNLVCGDVVVTDENSKVILEKLPRKNCLFRPQIANIDKLFICLAPVPKPDFLLLDKLIVMCYISNIQPIIIINKTDLEHADISDYIKKVYSTFIDVIYCSNKTQTDLRPLLDRMQKSISCFAGQSAVGKSSIISKLLGSDTIQIGDLSEKIQRGKNTTRKVSLYQIENGFIADTPGFSLFDENLLTCKYNELKDYYPDFVRIANECKFNSCQHDKEIDCSIKRAVVAGLIDKGRYDRYIMIKNEMLKRWKNKYE